MAIIRTVNGKFVAVLERQYSSKRRQIMKKFIISALAISVFFIGLGALVQNTGAKLKSDDKALALVAKARQALGGDAAIRSVQSLRIVGSTTRKFNADGEARSVTGDTEIAFQF